MDPPPNKVAGSAALQIIGILYLEVAAICNLFMNFSWLVLQMTIVWAC